MAASPRGAGGTESPQNKGSWPGRSPLDSRSLQPQGCAFAVDSVLNADSVLIKET